MRVIVVSDIAGNLIRFALLSQPKSRQDIECRSQPEAQSGHSGGGSRREGRSIPDWLEIFTRIGAAALIGGGIGLNRHLHHKAVGLRTLSLVASGAAALVVATLHAAGGASHVDAMSRVIQGIMTGVGFIGAGVIMRNQTGDKIHGLTTAAGVWITAALGALCGIGEWKIIVALTAIVAVVLLTGGPIERWCDTALRNEPEERQ
jgi:putative Mg2+ transporter-C (MgtC) family protein